MIAESKEINKWDSPSKNDLFGREPFVDTIVKTIQSSKTGFNLGISARWGEGKSSILEQLRPKLEKLNYKVLTFEPWKYTQDQISIKRKFIIDISTQLGQKYDYADFYSSTEKQKDLDSKEYKELFLSRISKFVKFSLIAAVFFLDSLIILQWFIKWIGGSDINITQIFLTNLFIPVLAGVIPLINKLTEVTVKQVTPKIESAEQFEQRFNEVIDEIMCGCNPPNKIIIFVDDLDRCSHTEVEQILTALFTFFNNKKCTYIITADHTVIRRYISRFLQLDDEVDDKGEIDIKKTNDIRQKEATEYLKKIFQINFILPKITSDLLESWTQNLIDDGTVINFVNPYAREYLTNLILNNFQGNPRKIKHFIRTLTFQLEAIGRKIACLTDQSSDEAKNLNKVQQSPELLAKILIMQDRFPDFYERLISEPRILQRHEDGEIADDKDLQNLLAQEPRFFNSVTRSAEMKTIDPYYFLYFSGSTGYSEVKIVDPAEVKALARNADFEGLTKIISGLTDEPRNAQVEYIKREYEAPEIQPPEKVNIIRSLIHTISLIEEPTLKLQKLKDVFDAKVKYATEFVSLQSIDFSKFISFADINIVNQLFVEPQFAAIELQNQILNAFTDKQEEVDKGEITDRFMQAIAEGVDKNDSNSSNYLSFLKKLSIENISSSKFIQDALINTYKKTENPLKEEIFDILLEFKDKILPTQRQEFEEIIINVLEEGTVNESVLMFKKIPEKINKANFNLSRLLESIKKRIITSNNNEIEQFISILADIKIREEFELKTIDSALFTVVDMVNSKDDVKRSSVIEKLPDLISYAADKSGLLKAIVKSVGINAATESNSILSIVQGMTSFWNENLELKKEFAKDLKTFGRQAKDGDVRDMMIKSSNEMIPPPEPKKKKKSTVEE